MPNSPQANDSNSSRLQTDSLLASVALLLVMTVVQRSVGFGRGILFCRWLSPEVLGEWEMAYSFLLLAAPLAVLGVPGSFGRYLEHYRQRGHLHTFLRRTATWTAGWSLAGVATIFVGAEWFSELLFGTTDRVSLVRGIALCLTGVILLHTLTSLLTALRLFRVVSAVNFAQSVVFAALAITLLMSDASVASILIGYGVACLLASVGGIVWIWPGLREVERAPDRLLQTEFWSKLLRFAFFVWLTNMLAHLFAIVDRYMLIHYSNLSPTEALDQVGHYHSSRIVPLLLLSVADLLSGLIMPHLSHDWEAGRHQEVGDKTRFCVKLTGLGMLGVGVAVLIGSPLLFDVVLAGKYSDGLHILPWTLTACLWYAIYFVAQNYLWCAERARLATIPLAVGLVVNVCLNLLLLPRWGLLGAVVATACSTAVCLTTILLLSRRHGMRIDTGTWIVLAAPLSLVGGPAIAGGVWLVLALAVLGTNWILDVQERRQLRTTCLDLVNKVWPSFRKRVATTTGG